MQYKVPQNVEREDKIVGPLTLKQLILVAVGGGISYLLYINLAKNYQLGLFDLFLISLPLLFTLFLSFGKVKDMTMSRFIICFAELMLKARKRYWVQRAGDIDLSAIGSSYKASEKKEASTGEPLSKLERLNQVLDTINEDNGRSNIDKARDEELLQVAFAKPENHEENKKHTDVLDKQRLEVLKAKIAVKRKQQEKEKEIAEIRKQAEEKVRREIEEKARKEAEEKAKRDTEEKVKREAEEKARRDAEEKVRKEMEAKGIKEGVEVKIENKAEPKIEIL